MPRRVFLNKQACAPQARQCLIGGNYGLLNRTTFEPQPDYFIAWIYRRLFDDVLGAPIKSVHATTSQATASTGLRVFAFRGQGSLPGSLGNKQMLYVLINLSVKHAFSVTLPAAAAAASGGQRAEWHLRGAPDERATTITVNGETLALTPSLPPFLWDLGKLAKEAAPGAPVAVAPASIVFAAV